jgi:2-methylcitrate dehydratase PrpD
MSGEGLVRLAEFAAAADIASLPQPIVEKAKACALYGLAVGIGSARTEAPAMAARALDAVDRSDGPGTRFLDGARRSVEAAAFANGVLLHARVQEDAHPAGHIGVAVIPAALAVAEKVGADGKQLLAALAAGYEVALRIGRDHAAALSERGFRTTPVYGPIGAAAAAARLLRLDARQTRDALALAANASGGLREFVDAGTPEFSLHAGMAARSGISAAFLARAGMAAASSTLEGSAGFFRAFADPSPSYAARLVKGLGETFEFDEIAYKPYPVCQFHRGIIRAALALRGSAGDVPPRRIMLRMHPFEADFFGVRYAGPFASFPQTFMSAPFCTALAWTRGAVTLAGLHDFAAHDVLALASRVDVVADSRQARYQARVEIELGDGRRVDWEEREGPAAYRLTWEGAVAMTRALAAEVDVPDFLVEALVGAASSLDRANCVTQLVDAATHAAGSARGAGERRE